MVPAGLTALRARFEQALRALGADGDVEPLFDALVGAWSEPRRAYHDLSHLQDTLAELDAAPSAERERRLVEAALWFHDAVYDPQADDNEARSAAWARTALTELGVSAEDVSEIARLILVTRHDRVPEDPAGRLLCDIDLAILGRDPAAFDRYDAAIRAEYRWLPEKWWREGRRQVLSGLRAREPLFQTPHFRSRYEAQAGRNLRRALDRLTSEIE